MAKFKHPSNSSFDIKELILNHLYEQFYQEITDEINQIILKNCRVSNIDSYKFSYKGKSYYLRNIDLAKNKNLNKSLLILNSKLHLEMDEILERINEVKQERIYIDHYIGHVLTNFFIDKNLIKIFPDCLSDIINKIFLNEPMHKFNQAKALQINQQNEKAIKLIENRLLGNLIIYS